MLQIIFRNPMRPEPEVRTAETLDITGDVLACSAPAGVTATLKNSMWWVDGGAYTSADVAGVVMVTFLPNAAIGPFFHLRIVSEFLYEGDSLVARRHEGGWLATIDKQTYQQIRLSSAA